MLFIAGLLICFSANAIKLSHEVSAFDGRIGCGETATGNTRHRHPRFGNPAPDAVYMFTLGSRSAVNVNTCGSSFDTWVRIYDANAEEEVCGCDDCGNCGVQTVLDCELSPGDYLIVIDGYSDSSGDFTFTVGCPPAEIACGGTEVGSTEVAANIVGNDAGDATYVFTLNQATTVVVDSCQSTFDTWIRIMDTNFTTEFCGCDDCGGCSVQTVLSCDLPAGYYGLVVDGYSSSVGDFSITLTCPRASLGCAETVEGSTRGAADVVGSGAGDVLYDFHADTLTDVVFSSCGSQYDTWLRVLSTDLSHEYCGCDDCGDCGVQTVLECQVSSGDYVLAVGGYSSSEGDFSVESTCAPPVLLCNQNYVGDTRGASSVVGSEAGDHIYTFSVSETTHVSFDSCGSQYDTFIHVFHDSIDGAVACACDDCGSCGLQTVLSCVLLPGNYVVSMDGFSSSEGEYSLTVDCFTFDFGSAFGL